MLPVFSETARDAPEYVGCFSESGYQLHRRVSGGFGCGTTPVGCVWVQSQMVVFKPSLSKIAQHQKSVGKRHNTFLEGSDRAEVLQKHEKKTRAPLEVWKTADKTTQTVSAHLLTTCESCNSIYSVVVSCFPLMCFRVDSNHIHPCLRPLNLRSCSASRNTNAVLSTRLYRTHTYTQLHGWLLDTYVIISTCFFY